MSSSVYTIAAGQNFSKVFARHLMQQESDSPERLTQYHLLLPTRRACRIMRDAFLQLNDGKPLLLPAMSPIGEVDEQDLSLTMFGQSDAVLDIPEAISPLQRQLMLSKLIQSMPDFAQGPDHALMLAQSLCSLIDQVLVEELSFDALDTLVPEDFATHWQVTLDFLKIVSEHWPKILTEHNLIEVVTRRRLMLEALGAHWQDCPPDVPVIAAGSTGSIPVVGRFLKIVSQLPQGSVVLPGVDRVLDDEAWDCLGESHPQYILKKTLQTLGVERGDVGLIGDDPSPRSALGRFALLPAAVSGRWGAVDDMHYDKALEGVQYYSCHTEHQEAGLVALLMREMLQQPRKVCAFVTPDRVLARRVAAACRRWDIEVDDSAGQSLADNELGKFSLLILNAAREVYDPSALLALLKSPLCRVRRDKANCRRLIGVLERSVLRAGHIIGSFEQLRGFIEDAEVLSYFDDVHVQLQAIQGAPADFIARLKVHLQVMEYLAATGDMQGDARLWRGDAGESAVHLFADMLEHGALVGDVHQNAYARIFGVFLKEAQVRSAYGVHPRLLILGQLEARLTHADRIILGGLNEGSWTPSNDHDPWMSKPMRKRFGLPSVEQSIGIAAHDFMQGFACDDVILTRSEKVDRSPSIPVRWLSRFDTVLKACGRGLDDLTDPSYFAWLEQMDDHGDFAPSKRPEPRPPLLARPNGASVTKIETWLQNPYAIYAYYTLGLKPMKPLLQDNDAALRGTILHDILDRFTAEGEINEPRIIEIAQEVTAQHLVDPDMLYYWWPKFYRIAEWFVSHEKSWRMDAKFLAGEAHGDVTLTIDGSPFRLYGRADRIDRMHGGYALIDYKSGGAYTKSGLQKGAYPQMPLEAIMISEVGFEGVARGDVRYIGYWLLNGGKVVALDAGLEDTVAIVRDGLSSLVRAFREVDVPFYCVPDALNAPRFNDYEQLARLKEWAALGGDESGGGA